MGEVWGLEGHELVSDLCPTNNWTTPLSKFLTSGSFPTTESPALGACGMVVCGHMWVTWYPVRSGPYMVVLLPTPTPFHGLSTCYQTGGTSRAWPWPTMRGYCISLFHLHLYLGCSKTFISLLLREWSIRTSSEPDETAPPGGLSHVICCVHRRQHWRVLRFFFVHYLIAPMKELC